MEKDPYIMLGINEKILEKTRKSEDLDLAIAEKLKEKIEEIRSEINVILAKQETDQAKEEDQEQESDQEQQLEQGEQKEPVTVFTKVSEIDAKVQEMFSHLFAYMKIMTHQAREDYGNEKVSSVEEDLKNMQEKLKRSIKIEQRKKRLDTPVQYNAYQIFGISEESSATGKTIAKRTLSRINMISKRKVPDVIEDMTDVLFSLQGYTWAYSKLNTPQNRSNYKENIKALRLSNEAKKSDSLIGNVRREASRNFISAQLQALDYGENSARVTQIGRLINRVFNLDESAINQYALDRNVNGEQYRVIFYSNIDMERLQSDNVYADFVRGWLLSENTIPLAKKYLGGYIGEIGSKMVEVEGETINKLVVGHKLEHIAICRRYQRDRIVEKRNTANSEPTVPPQGGDFR